MKKYYVYILLCRDGKYYVGLTSNIEKRLFEHQQGSYRTSFTSSRRPLELVYLSDFTEIHQAISFEKQLKRWTNKKKAALIAQQWDSLYEFAACQNITTYYSDPILYQCKYHYRNFIHALMTKPR